MSLQMQEDTAAASWQSRIPGPSHVSVKNPKIVNLSTYFAVGHSLGLAQSFRMVSKSSVFGGYQSAVNV